MLGQTAFSRGSGATADNRIFIYEVNGLQQNDVTVQSEHQIRSSASTFIQVPASRMNEQMQRILRLGGKIVGIHPLGESPVAPEPETKSKSKSKS